MPLRRAMHAKKPSRERRDRKFRLTECTWIVDAHRKVRQLRAFIDSADIWFSCASLNDFVCSTGNIAGDRNAHMKRVGRKGDGSVRIELVLKIFLASRFRPLQSEGKRDTCDLICVRPQV
jgi:hypothetical protein